MHAANYYNYEGAAALKPALEMMTQLRNFNYECACGLRRCWSQWGGIELFCGLVQWGLARWGSWWLRFAMCLQSGGDACRESVDDRQLPDLHLV